MASSVAARVCFIETKFFILVLYLLKSLSGYCLNIDWDDHISSAVILFIFPAWKRYRSCKSVYAWLVFLLLVNHGLISLLALVFISNGPFIAILLSINLLRFGQFFFNIMLWGIHLSNLCILDVCTASGSVISCVIHMYVRVLIFQSINDSLLCFSCPPWTWRAAASTTGLSRQSTGSGSSWCLDIFSRQGFLIFFITTVTLRITITCISTKTSPRTRILLKLMNSADILM
jgi:hypothetical protein